jgi:hypothetical protein
MDGDWYLPSKITIGTQETTCLLKYPTGFAIDIKMIPMFVGLYGQSSEEFFTPERIENSATNEGNLKDGKNYFASESVNGASIVEVEKNPKISMIIKQIFNIYIIKFFFKKSN